MSTPDDDPGIAHVRSEITALRRRRVSIAVALLVSFVVGRWSTAWSGLSPEAWPEDTDTEIKADGTKIVRHYHKGDQLPFRLELELPDGWRHEGEVSPSSGKQHGPWRMKPPIKEARDGKVDEFVWYWFGEKITEGEWHSRSK